MASVKWLARIEAVEKPFRGEFQTRRYVYAEGVPVTRIRIKSMFTDVPDLVRVGVPVRVIGLAWGGEGVRGVEVEIDGERHAARLVGPVLPHAWRRFELDWTPPAATATSSPAGPPTWPAGPSRTSRNGTCSDTGTMRSSGWSGGHLASREAESQIREARVRRPGIPGRAAQLGRMRVPCPPRALRKPAANSSEHHSQTLPAQS